MRIFFSKNKDMKRIVLRLEKVSKNYEKYAIRAGY
jgi:hypothetical protein